jgi:hypothetical protein
VRHARFTDPGYASAGCLDHWTAAEHDPSAGQAASRRPDGACAPFRGGGP